MTTLSSTFEPTLNARPAASTTLQGGWLWLGRGVWVILFGLSSVMYAVLLPLILQSSDLGDWTIESSAALFGVQAFSPEYRSYALALLSLKYVAVGVYIAVALYIFWRKSDDWLALLVSATLLVLPHAFNLGGYTESWYLYPSPWNTVFSGLDAFLNGLSYGLLFLVFFLFPDGRFVPHWARWGALLALVLTLFIWVDQYLHTLFIFDDGLPWLVGIAAFFVLLLLVTWSQIYRYRHVSTDAQRVQTRIVVSGLAAIAAGFAVLLVLLLGVPGWGDSPGSALLSFLFPVVMSTLLPLSFGVAMLRDQLWRSERALNRAYVYGALTLILLAVYVLVVAALSEILRAVNNFVIAAIATGIIALLFQPLRERLQRSINRLMYGERDEPIRVLNLLGAQLEDTAAADTALPLIVETIGEALRVPFVALELENGGAASRATYGNAPTASALATFPLKYRTECVGTLRVAPRSPQEQFSAVDMQLLENLARQAGAVAYTAQLNTQLQHSRERIITEREQERRRLRRDLHDDLGPTLASQTLKLDAAVELVRGPDADSESARRILQDVKSQTQNTIADIRRIIYELRPPALDDLGLKGALAAHIASANRLQGLEITLNAPDALPTLSAAAQVNAYRIVMEAVNNVIQHAHASHCTVTLASNAALHLEVKDDGVGLPTDWRPGVGMTSMRERAEELGGSFQIGPNEPTGTRIMATLPVSNTN